MSKLNKIKPLLKDNSGFSDTVAMMLGSLLLIMLVAVVLGVFSATQTQTTLDTFADEMAVKVGMVGKCDDIEIDKRFEQLVLATGLTPTLEVTSDATITGSEKLVQYGDAIHVKLTLKLDKIGIGDFKIPFSVPFEATRICQSEQYWK